MRGSRSIAVMVSVALLLALLLSGCRNTNSPGAATADSSGSVEPGPVVVTVQPVELRTIQRKVQVVGTFSGFEEVTITPKVEGRVAQVNHDVGDIVHPGDVLMTIDPVDYELAVLLQKPKQ